jgi:hypothetical protein
MSTSQLRAAVVQEHAAHGCVGMKIRNAIL